MTLLDLDDFADDERSLEDLLRLRDLQADIQTFKATLFTIPARCSPTFIRTMIEEYQWLDLVQHGWHHRDNYECLSWTKADCKAALLAAREMGFTTRGFKAPGWQISDGCYEALAEEGYWVADQEYNNWRRPLAMPAYVIMNGRGHWVGYDGNQRLETATAIHGHLGNLNGPNANALELIMDDIRAAAAKDSDFRFIREVME